MNVNKIYPEILSKMIEAVCPTTQFAPFATAIRLDILFNNSILELIAETSSPLRRRRFVF